MHDVFISYSRKDRALAERLAQSLSAQGKSTWIDWKDIPPTAEFLEEIRRAIEAADSFLLLISPDWCASSVCQLELDHAAKHRKRLIPLVACAGPQTDVPQEVALLNWIPFDDSIPFTRAIEQLTTAIDTDLEWVQAHTELVIRAVNWEKRGKSHSALLRGAELTAAEQRVVQAGDGRLPSLTPLQQEYIIAGRRNAARTLRYIIGSVSAALVITIALAVIAFILRSQAVEQRSIAEERTRLAFLLRNQAVEQRRIAEKQRRIAEEQRRIAEERARIADSRRLAATARIQLGVQLDLAMLLSVEAYHGRATPEARSTLLASMQQSPYLRRYLHGHSGGVWHVAFHPKGKLLASCGESELIVWNVESGRPLKVLSGDYEPTPIAFSPDGSLLGASGRGGNPAVFWDTRTWSIVSSDLRVKIQGFAADGSALLKSFYDGREYSKVDIRKRSTTADARLESQFEPDRFAFAANRDGTIVASEMSGVVVFWNAVTGERLNSPEDLPRVNPSVLQFHPDGRRLLSGDIEGRVKFWDVSTGKPNIDEIQALDGRLSALAISADGELIATGGDDAQVRLWSSSWHTQIGGVLSAHRGKVNDVAFSPNGKLIASASDDGSVILWDVIRTQPEGESLRGSRLLADVMMAGTPEPFPIGEDVDPLDYDVGMFERMAVKTHLNADATMLALGESEGMVQVWDLANRRRVLGPVKLVPVLSAIALSPDSRLLAVAGVYNDDPAHYEGRVHLIDVFTGRLLREFRDDESFFGNHLAFSPDGKTLVIAGYGEFRFVDVRSHAAGISADHHTTNLTTVIEFEPRGVRFVAVNTDPEMTLWDAARRRQLRVLSDQSPEMSAVAFSPDGSLLAVARKDGNVVVENAATFQPVAAPFRADPKGVTALTFRRDGKLLATGGESGIQLWDVETREPIGERITNPAFSFDSLLMPEVVGTLAFRADGKTLVATYPYSQIVVRWDLDPQSWMRRACAAANRKLTRLEWSQYMGAIPYKPTCTSTD